MTITGATTGALWRRGQVTTVVVTATDKGGVSSIAFKASGVLTANETRVPRVAGAEVRRDVVYGDGADDGAARAAPILAGSRSTGPVTRYSRRV